MLAMIFYISRACSQAIYFSLNWSLQLRVHPALPGAQHAQHCLKLAALASSPFEHSSP